MIKRLKKALREWHSRRTRQTKARQMVKLMLDSGIIR